MKSQKEILTWLKHNLGPRATAGLTSTDTQALVTSVNLANLISYPGAPAELFDAYRAIVSQMQDTTRHLAFHAIAMELDWGHRYMIWQAAGLPDVEPRLKCAFEPGGSARV